MRPGEKVLFCGNCRFVENVVSMQTTTSTIAKIRYLYRYVKPYWKQMLIAILALVVGSLIILALPWTLRIMVDSVFVSQDLARLNQLSLGLLLLFVIQSVMIWLQSYLFSFVANRVIADLRMDVYNHLLMLPIHFFNNQRPYRHHKLLIPLWQ